MFRNFPSVAFAFLLVSVGLTGCSNSSDSGSSTPAPAPTPSVAPPDGGQGSVDANQLGGEANDAGLLDGR